MTTHIFLLFSFKSSSFASVRFKWPWRQNRIYQAIPAVMFQFINHDNFLNIQCHSIDRNRRLKNIIYKSRIENIYIFASMICWVRISATKCNNMCILFKQLGHGYRFYSFPYDACFFLYPYFIFYQFKHNQKCRLLPDTTRWRNQRINGEWVFTILCITKSSLDFSTKFDE